MISSVAGDDSTQRPRGYSHTRTNSSSSSGSSHVQSPSANGSFQLPGRKPSLGRMYEEGEASDGSANTTTETSSSHKVQYQHSASEAAAVAAIRNTVNNVQITSAQQRPSISHSQSHNDSSPPVQSQPQFQPISYQYTPQPHNNKLQSVAASAAAFAAKPKESALSKAKMFARQAKPHLSSSSSNSNMKELAKRKNVDLTINTKQMPPPSRPSLSERSPLARPSKELERIASIGSPVSVAANKEEKQHKHHISFRGRKESHGGVVLSSSSSNSKLISEASIYSFHPNSPGMAAIDVKNLNTKEDRDQLAEESWTLLCSRVMPLFSGEGLRVPVEDLNNLVIMHLNFLIQQGGNAKTVISEFKTFLRTGVLNLDTGLSATSNDSLVPRLVKVWTLFFLQVVPYLEGVFLPLQTEFEGLGQVLSAEQAKKYWSMLLEKQDRLTTRRYILMAFRDYIVVPISDRLMSLANVQSYIDFEDDNGAEVTDNMAKILQCLNIMASIQSDDEYQKRIDSLVRRLRGSWMTSRTGKDRRGFVLNNPKP